MKIEYKSMNLYLETYLVHINKTQQNKMKNEKQRTICLWLILPTSCYPNFKKSLQEQIPETFTILQHLCASVFFEP